MHRKRAEEFLKESASFRLGDLPTEGSHPKTKELSKWAQAGSPEELIPVISLLKDIDHDALTILHSKAPLFETMRKDIKSTLEKGHKIYFCGCGATGRLSLSLEFLWRKERSSHADRVVGLMAGGDVALVKAIEGFEDFPDYGARHLLELGFSDGDLLISTTEGGETPYVIGATEKGSEVSKQSPYFVYCNPDDVLCAKVDRSRRVIQNPKIKKISLPIGPMALSGSTRLQACTVMMLGVGLALLNYDTAEPIAAGIRSFQDLLKKTDLSFLGSFVFDESDLYKRGSHVLYVTDEFGITVFTDTTERAPTFSLIPFENEKDQPVNPALCFLSLTHANSVEDAWQKLFGRPPRPLEWREAKGLAGQGRLLGYDFSLFAEKRRFDPTSHLKYQKFSILRSEQNSHELVLALSPYRHNLSLQNASPLFEHLLLKVLLNIHSLLVMGRLGRYQGNVMTWVKPSNKKLIDRSIRYVSLLLKNEGIARFSYDDIAYQLFAEIERLKDNESVVLKTFHSLHKI